MSLKFEDNSFDSYISALVIMHVPDPSKLVSEAYRVLKSKCRAAFSVVSPKTNTFEWMNPAFPEEKNEGSGGKSFLIHRALKFRRGFLIW